MYEDELKHLSEKMDKSIQALRNEFTSIRTGQASPSLLDRVFVDYYGSKTPVTQVASVTVPEARMLVVQPWDKGILKDIEKAPKKKGKNIYWMHTIPFWSGAVQEALAFNENAQIAGCELSRTFEPDFDPEDPYDAMARRMVYHGLNGSAVRRIEAGIRHAKDVKADGAVWFGHWGCKHTLGAAQLAKKKFEEAGIPMLLLDGDGCDRSHGGEGQTSTRLGAFLEMLGAEEMEGGQDE